jgi:hypothetical protein
MLAAGGEDDDGAVAPSGKARSKGGKSTAAAGQRKKLGRPRKQQDDAYGGGEGSSGHHDPGAKRKSGRPKTKRYVDSDDSDDDVDTKRTGPDAADDMRSELMVWILSEWPGQSEGEPIDLPHFWNVVSMMYPEKHSQEVRSWIAKHMPCNLHCVRYCVLCRSGWISCCRRYS